MKYIVEWAWTEGGDDYLWKKTGNEYETIMEAARAAGDWMAVCLENNYAIAVRLRITTQ